MDFSQAAASLIRMMLMPPASLLLLMALGWLARRRWPRTGRSLLVLGAVTLLVLFTNAGALLLVRPLENLTAPLDAAKPNGAQAIVVLGAGGVEAAPEYGGRDVPDQVALVRLQYAAHLQHATGLPLMVSGGNGSAARKVEPKAVAMARTLREDFRTPVAWIEDRSEDTRENAAFSARMLRAAGVHRVLLVTHAMHMPRARLEFEREGIEVVEAPTQFYSRAPWSPYMLVPTASGLYKAFYATHEWVGLARTRISRGPFLFAKPAAPRSST